LCSSVLAQPALVSRVIRVFDFEERAAGNLEDVPMDWDKIEGSGRPHYVNGKLSTTFAASGRHSFEFELDGGNLIYRYPSGRIPVVPGANYKTSGMIRTQGLKHARARIVSYFTDVDNRPVKHATKSSPAFISTREGFEPVSSQSEAPEGAAWLVIELQLVQPSMWRESTLGAAA